jgi:hypothetical protein
VGDGHSRRAVSGLVGVGMATEAKAGDHMNARQPDALSEAILAQQPELAGHVHYVNGRAWCDGINHTTACDPAFACTGREHYWLRESDGVVVCQICAAVKP